MMLMPEPLWPPKGSSAPPAKKSAGRVVGWPRESTMSPGVTSRPSAPATRSLPSATPAVEKSRTRGPYGAPGAAHAKGLVPRARPVPPNGATTAPELQNARPIRPPRASSATYSPSRPTWLQSRMVTAATPCSRTRSAASPVASWAAGWPKPQPPSTMAAARSRRVMTAAAAGRICPSAIHGAYWASRITPCESWPTRLDRTRDRATCSAISAGVPSAVSARPASVTSSSGENLRVPASSSDLVTC